MNHLVNVRKFEYEMAKKFGFVPKYKASRSVNGKHYYINDADYITMLKILQGRSVYAFYNNTN